MSQTRAVGRGRIMGCGRGFTLIELLVVVAIVALLLAILMPGLGRAREQAKRAKCLANLKELGVALHQYALEDAAEQPIPIHESMLRSVPFRDWRTINWFAWGGRSGQLPFRTEAGDVLLSAEGSGAELKPEYDARRRPLNRYALAGIHESDTRALEQFHCPSDRGYPDHLDIDDSPRPNAERACYDTLGNSYRASLAMVTMYNGDLSSAGHLSAGPWGHKLSSLRATSRLVLAGEPTFFNMIGRDDVNLPQPDPVLVTGWHRRTMEDNLLFCDGSARVAHAGRQQVFDAAALEQMEVSDVAYLSRGAGWQLDDYPTVGARLWGEPDVWRATFPDWDTKWPFARRQENMRR